MYEEEIRDRAYYKQLNYEGDLAQQINRIAGYRSARDWGHYEVSVDTLAIMLPSDMRQNAFKYKKDNGIKIDCSENGILKYDEYWAYCNVLLEKGNLIFKIGKGPSEFGTM